MATPIGGTQLPPAYPKHLDVIQHRQSDDTAITVGKNGIKNNKISPLFYAKLAKVGNAMRKVIGKIKKTYGPLAGKIGRLRHPRLGARKGRPGAAVKDDRDIIQIMLTDPRDRTVLPKNVMSTLINDGYTLKQNGKEISDYLINNPNSSLFSSKNISFDGFEISLKQAVSIPGIPGNIDRLILADRNKAIGELNPALAAARSKNAANIISPLLNIGYTFQNSTIEINDFLIKNPQSRLFSSDNILITGYQISFKQPEKIPGTSIIIDKLIIDFRDNNNGEFRGAPALDVIKNQTFTSLAHLCAIMTFSDQLNVVKMRTARLIAGQLNDSITRQRLVVPQNAEAIDSLVKYHPDTDRYESRFVYSAFNPRPKRPEGGTQPAIPLAAMSGEPQKPALGIAAITPAADTTIEMPAPVINKPVVPPLPQWIAATKASRTKATGFHTHGNHAAQPDASPVKSFNPPAESVVATPFTLPADVTGKTVLGATEGVKKLRSRFETPGRDV